MTGAGKLRVARATLALRDTTETPSKQRIVALAELVMADAELSRALGRRTD